MDKPFEGKDVWDGVNDPKTLTDEQLLFCYRFMHQHKIGPFEQWKKVEKEILHRMGAK